MHQIVFAEMECIMDASVRDTDSTAALLAVCDALPPSSLQPLRAPSGHKAVTEIDGEEQIRNTALLLIEPPLDYPSLEHDVRRSNKEKQQ